MLQINLKTEVIIKHIEQHNLKEIQAGQMILKALITYTQRLSLLRI